MIYVFPLETYARELPWRVHFACYLLETHPNAKVYIAETSKAVDIACMLGPCCIFIGKHIYSVNSSKDAKYFHRLSQSGAKVVFIEEEGGLHLKGDYSFDLHVWQKRCPYDLIGIDSVFTLHWGEYQKHLTQYLYGGSNSRHYVGGAPSIDSCMISKKAKSFEYVSSSLPRIGIMSNGGLGSIYGSIQNYYDFYLCKLATGNLSQLSNLIVSEIRLFQEMELVSALLEDNLYEFRPHPGIAHFATKLNSKYLLSNSTLITINDFLDSKRLLIHDGCTTSVQAFFMDIPTVSLSLNSQFVSIGDHYSMADRATIYRDVRDKGFSPILNTNFALPKIFADLLQNQKGKLNSFAALLEICDILDSGNHKQCSTYAIDNYIRIRSAGFAAKDFFVHKEKSKFSHFILDDIAKFVDQWQRYVFHEQCPAHEYHFCQLGLLAVKIWRA